MLQNKPTNPAKNNPSNFIPDPSAYLYQFYNPLTIWSILGNNNKMQGQDDCEHTDSSEDGINLICELEKRNLYIEDI